LAIEVVGTSKESFAKAAENAAAEAANTPHVSQLVVCDPRKNALLKDGSKSDRIDARSWVMVRIAATQLLQGSYPVVSVVHRTELVTA
jgi:flavin-binding protein dodecin